MRVRNRPLWQPRRAATLLVCVGLAACDAATEPRPDDRPFRHVQWHLHAAAGAPLPAPIAEDSVDGLPELTFADSALVEIRDDGTWRERVHLSSWRSRARVSDRVVLDEGTWSLTAEGYRFTSTIDGRSTIAAAVARDSVVLRRPLRDGGDADPVVASLRAVRPAPGPVAEWRATHVGNDALPATILVLDPILVGGRWISSHLIADSARLALLPTGEYVHRVYASEWEGPVGGGPTQLVVRLFHYDHGDWQRSGAAMSLESEYLQNHRMSGSFSAGLLRLQHGFTHGDPPVEFRYGDRR